MKHPVAPFLFLFLAPLSAKEPAPWLPLIETVMEHFPAEERIYAWKDGGYDEAGRLAERVVREFSPEGAMIGGGKLTYAYSGVSSLAPRPHASRPGRRFEAAPRGPVLLIRENGHYRDPLGRMAVPR